jgi:AraC family transcriptional regulator, regulatory protein of adaptative response / methylated-DNA-[protein]-cysteine methyltransferase
MIRIRMIETPLGPMIAGSFENSLCLLEFSDRRMLKTEYAILTKYFKSEISEGEVPLFNDLCIELDQYFAGNRKEFTVPLIYSGTDFQKRVWNELLKIQFGTTRSYKEQSIALGKAESVRAVASANGMNKISIIVPCHRVIGEDGNLTGYGGGLWRKKWLLDHEKKFSGIPTDLSLF